MNNMIFRAYDSNFGMSDTFTLKDAVNSDIDEFDVFMMYSGVNDKQGNKIFEGDIVRVKDMPSSPHEKTYITEVIYKDGCFFLSDIDGSEIALYETLKESYPNGYHSTVIEEVIGNIYEEAYRNNIHTKLDEAKMLFKEQLMNTYMMITKEHEEHINDNVNKIVDLIYSACMESINKKGEGKNV